MSLLSLIIKQEHIFCLCWNILQIPGRSWWPQKSLWEVTTPIRSLKYHLLSFVFFESCNVHWSVPHYFPPGSLNTSACSLTSARWRKLCATRHWSYRSMKNHFKDLVIWVDFKIDIHPWILLITGSIMKPGLHVESRGRRHSPCVLFFEQSTSQKMRSREMILQTNSIGSRILKARAGPSSETIVVTESLNCLVKVVWCHFGWWSPVWECSCLVEAITKATRRKTQARKGLLRTAFAFAPILWGSTQFHDIFPSSFFQPWTP